MSAASEVPLDLNPSKVVLAAADLWCAEEMLTSVAMHLSPFLFYFYFFGKVLLAAVMLRSVATHLSLFCFVFKLLLAALMLTSVATHLSLSLSTSLSQTITSLFFLTLCLFFF